MNVDLKYLDEKDQPGIFEPVMQSLGSQHTSHLQNIFLSKQ